jgi:hypothetical protein
MEENVKFYLVLVILTNVRGYTATFTRPLWVPHFADISIACPCTSSFLRKVPYLDPN